MWRISLMAAAHGDPLRQSQRRSRHGDTREDLYPIDFQAYQMSPTCTGSYRCPPTEDSMFGLPDETTTLPPGVAVVSQDAFYQQDMDKPISKSPALESLPNKKPSRMPCRFGLRIQQLCSSLRDRWRKLTGKSSEVSIPEEGTHRKRSDHGSSGTLDSSSSRCCRSFISIDPTLPFHYRWMVLVSLAVLYNLIFVVGRAVFWELNNAVPHLWWFLDYTSDAIYLIDSIIHAHEGYLEQGLLVNDAAKLRRHYIETGRWKTDLLSLLPTDIAYYWWPPDNCMAKVPCAVIVRANRLFRLPRMCEFFDRTETGTGYPNAFRICKVVLAILVLIHWNACFYFAISYVIGFGTDNWVYNTRGERNSTLSRQYIYSFYWSTLTLTTIGETPQPENDAEYLFVVADFLAGVLIFATIVGNIGSMISNMNLARVDFQNRMDGVKQYMAFRKVSKDLEARVIRWFAYTWANKQALDEDRVLAALPDKLKAEIAIHVHLDTLKQVQIFQDCEPGLLEELVLKLRLQVFSPGDYICRKGDVGKEMYIVKRGRLSVVADDGETVLATLGSGSVFGEVSVLEIAGNRTGNRRTANVRSLGYSDLFCLAKRDLWEALVDYPEARHSLMERGCQLLRKDGLLDENAFIKSQAEHETLKDKVDRLENILENLEEKLMIVAEEVSTFHFKMKRRASRIDHKKHSSPTIKTLLMPKSTTVEEEDEGGDNATSRRSFQGAVRPNAILQRQKQRSTHLIQYSDNDWNKTREPISSQEITDPVESEFDLGSSNLDLTMSEQELRNIHVSVYKPQSTKWELIHKCRFPRVARTRSSLQDELQMLKINLSLHDKIIALQESQMFKEAISNSKNKKFQGAPYTVKKIKPEKIKDLLTAIEESETAKTDKVICKFLKRNSILRKEHLSIKKFLIEFQGLRRPESRLQNTQPVKITCPNCRFFIITKIERVSTARTKIFSFLLTILGLCNAAFMMYPIQDTVHVCPLCQIYLGFCPALGLRCKKPEVRSFLWNQSKSANSKKISRKIWEMVSASSTSAKNLFAEPKLRLCDRVQVNVNNVAAIARQIQRGSKSSENLIAAAKNFALQEAAIENSETNLKKLKLLTTHMHNQLDSLHNSSPKMELVLEQVRSMQR